MKKIIVSTSAILLIAACSKKNATPVNSTDLEKTAITNPYANAKQNPSGWGICCVWNGVDKCVSPKVNCFDEVIIKGVALESAFRNFNSAVGLGSKAISAFFPAKNICCYSQI